MPRLPLREGLPEPLGAASADLQDAFGTVLDSYVKVLRHFKKLDGPKVINDPVWRTVRIEPWELAVLDSPLLQRLRNVHQLGLAGYVFPGANYSRFEHSIGVLHQTQRLIDALNRNARAYAARTRVPPEAVVSPGEEVALRLTALLHDIGHGFFSHVSERAIARIDPICGRFTVGEMRAAAKVYFNCPSAPQPSEIIACLLVLLPEFVALLDVASVPYWENDSHALASRIAKYIAGGRDPKRPFLSEIISGALDADKLDYMPRDCYMAGLPMPVDVDRLLDKLQAVSVMAGRLGLSYADANQLSKEESVEVLAVQLSGARAFEELVVSRVLLYDKLYNHQKVRALEGMMENALDLLVQSSAPFRKISTFLTLTDADILGRHLPQDGADDYRYRAAQELIASVQSRQVFVRAFAFGPSLINLVGPSQQEAEEEARTGWERLRPLVTRTRSNQALAFRGELTILARTFLKVAGQAGLAAELSEHHLVVDLPDVQGIAEKTRFYVGDEEQGVELYSKRFRVERWAEAYENQKVIGYVYCPIQYRAAIFLAARQAFKDRSGLEFGSQSWGMTKIPPGEIAALATTLVSRNALNAPFKLPEALEQRKHFLQGTERKKRLLQMYGTRIAELARRFLTFQSADGHTVSESSIQEWLLQFEHDTIPLAVDLLGGVRYWHRSALTDAFAAAIESHGYTPSQWIALGGSTTSARHLTYLWPDIRKRSALDDSVRVLGECADVVEGVPLVLYDDNVGSGGQGSTVLQQWFGLTKDKWIVQEEHVGALPTEALDRLKTCPIRFVFVTGRRAGLERLIAHTKKLVGHEDVEGHIVAPVDVSCFRASSRVFIDSDAGIRALKAFETAGRTALADKVGTWGETKIADRTLGYGNAGGLTVFYYNVPTTTVTALWKRCEMEECNWKALFPRRPRD